MEMETLQLNTKVSKMYRMRPINMAGHLPLLQSGQVVETVDFGSRWVQPLPNHIACGERARVEI